MELVLGQRSSPTRGFTPETPTADPPSVISDPPDPPDLTSNIHTTTPDPPTTTPNPLTIHHEALPSENGPADPDTPDEDQVESNHGSWKNLVLIM